MGVPHLEGLKERDHSSFMKKSVSHSKTYPWLVFNRTAEVQAVRLDTWVHDNMIPFIDFIWVDVQGVERDVIEGAGGILEIVKYFYTEYGEMEVYPEAMTREETVALLSRHDFDVIEKYSDKGTRGNLLFMNNA